VEREASAWEPRNLEELLLISGTNREVLVRVLQAGGRIRRAKSCKTSALGPSQLSLLVLRYCFAIFAELRCKRNNMSYLA
jgi:hypothetical protein